jgi:hypothetical protein
MFMQLTEGVLETQVEKGFERGNLSDFKRCIKDIDETRNLLRTNNPGKKCSKRKDPNNNSRRWPHFNV